jgi:Peptidase family M1 domain
VTKVLVRSWRIVPLICCLLSGPRALAQAYPAPSSSSHPSFSQSGQADCPQNINDLYARLRTVGLDPKRIFHVREASITRPNLNVTLEDGTLAFTEDICGRITGAFFIGDGDILVQPPNSIERASLTLFTGMAILEEQFNSAYLRFNDDTSDSLQPSLSPAADPAGFLKDWNDTVRALAEYDGLRLFLDFSHFLPAPGPAPAPQKFPSLLHLHITGEKLGTFEVFYDSPIPEPLWVGQLRTKNNLEFFDIWTSFNPPSAAAESNPLIGPDISIPAFRIRATVNPPVELQGSTEMDVRIHTGGERTVLFELSRYLRVDSVVLGDGHPLDFIQNTAVKGTDLARRGNDFVAVIFPAELISGQELKVRFHYAGDVLSDAGNGLLYVGARGSWYPNFGLSPASFDMEFHYPVPWTLVATGKRVSGSTGNASAAEGGGEEKVSHWISERPIPVAGFNLGKYVRAEAKAGKVTVQAYGTKGVEKSFPRAPAQIVQEPTVPAGHSRLNPSIPMVVTPPTPSPAHEVQSVADRAAKAVEIFSRWYGPYPYDSLSLTQMPGGLSQGWPSLVFLSSFAFLTPQEQIDLKLDPVTQELSRQVLVHETAHQWWGDLILWKSYHDQWIAEALANYSSFLVLERQNPAQFHQIMEKYRNDLLSKNEDGEWLRDAGPVTLGQRLTSSHFPNGYEAISYERGTWLMHMLRSMMRDAELASPHPGGVPNAEEPFFRALRKVRERYAGKSISTRDLIQVFEEELPRPLWYDSHHKLEWFVDSWIDGTAIPQLETRDIRISERERTAVVSGFIEQKDAPGNLITAVPVYGETSSNAMIFLGEVLADGAETAFHFAAPGGIRKVRLDPKQTILTAPK